jgi:prepilin signal peptidase PulO-like enzyme (type II secretory pathway)
MTNLWVLSAFAIGAILGSFICCQVRRVILREQLHGFQKFKQKPSHCEHCGQKLGWWEMIPVLSWLFLRGKCRSCNATIGLAEIFAELGLGLVYAFATIDLLATGIDPWSIASFALFLTLSCGLFAVFVFDFLTGEMPTHLLTFCVVCATLFIGLEWVAALSVGTFMLGAPLLVLASAAVLSGFYFVLSIAPAGSRKKSAALKGSSDAGFLRGKSEQRLVGDGDWMVALPLAIVLAHPILAIANLFLANIIGALIAVPFMITRKWTATTRIPFAPLLIAAFFFVFFTRDFIFEMFMVI